MSRAASQDSQGTAWRRCFVAGALALGLSVVGELGTTSPLEAPEAPRCPYATRAVVHGVLDDVGPDLGVSHLGQWAGRAVLYWVRSSRGDG